MKKTFISLFCAALCCSCEAQHSLTVKTDGMKIDKLALIVVNKNLTDAESQTELVNTNGEYTYDFTGDKARMAILNITRNGASQHINMFLVPGERGTLTCNTNGAEWSGTPFYNDLSRLEMKTDSLQDELTYVATEAQEKMERGENMDSLKKAIMPKFQSLKKQINDARINFIKNNPDNNVSASLLTDLENPEDGLALLSNSVKTGVFSDFIESIQNKINNEKAKKEATKAVADGQIAPDFKLRDINGKNLALSSLRGKYVIIDFWGSWCYWCIKGMPMMKQYYDKYNGKLEILGVDCNDTDQKWKDAVKKNNMTWKQVYCPKGSDLLTTYAIQGFPTKIVIDPQGKIVKTVCGEDPAFYKFLDETLGK